jgi:hypothetical protein
MLENLRRICTIRMNYPCHLKSFLSRCQEIFNIFVENEQPMYEEQKVMFLLNHEHVQHLSLKGAIDGMLVEHSQRRDTDRPLTFTEVANHFSTLDSELSMTKMAQQIGSVGSGKRGAYKGKNTIQKERRIKARKVVAISM